MHFFPRLLPQKTQYISPAPGRLEQTRAIGCQLLPWGIVSASAPCGIPSTQLWDWRVDVTIC